MTMSPSKSIRVMLVDDHTMVRKGLATFLKAFDDLELAGEAENGETAIQLCAKLQPDVILMDMVMPGMNGATATRTIRQQFPNIQVIALTSFKEEELVKSALEAGPLVTCSRMFQPMNWSGPFAQPMPAVPPYRQRPLKRWSMPPASHPRQDMILPNASGRFWL